MTAVSRSTRTRALDGWSQVGATSGHIEAPHGQIISRTRIEIRHMFTAKNGSTYEILEHP